MYHFRIWMPSKDLSGCISSLRLPEWRPQLSSVLQRFEGQAPAPTCRRSPASVRLTISIATVQHTRLVCPAPDQSFIGTASVGESARTWGHELRPGLGHDLSLASEVNGPKLPERWREWAVKPEFAAAPKRHVLSPRAKLRRPDRRAHASAWQSY